MFSSRCWLIVSIGFFLSNFVSILLKRQTLSQNHLKISQNHLKLSQIISIVSFCQILLKLRKIEKN